MRLAALLILTLCVALDAQPPPTFVAGQPLQAAQLNSAFSGLYTGKVGRWTGAGAPGDLSFSVIGDLYFDTTSPGSVYGCYRVHCTAVGTNNWVLVSGGGGGSVSSVGLSSNLGTVTGSPVTSSGTISLAVSAAQIVAKFSGCFGVLYLGADGACHAVGLASNPATLTTVNFSATPTFTRSTQIQEWAITLTGNVTSSSVSGAVAADIFVFNICQDGMGGRTFVWPATFGQAATVSPTAGICTKQTFYWSGSAAIALTPGVTTDVLIHPSGVAFAALPACSASYAGATVPVNNSTTAVWGATITGGGANFVMAFCNGTNWTVMGK